MPYHTILYHTMVANALIMTSINSITHGWVPSSAALPSSSASLPGIGATVRGSLSHSLYIREKERERERKREKEREREGEGEREIQRGTEIDRLMDGSMDG